MTDEFGNPVEPMGSEVFIQSNGEKVRIDYEKVYSYSSKSKSLATVVEYGWSDNREVYILDIDFDSFDAKLTQYRKDLKDYWASKSYCNELY
jgi:hypothetical protein